MAFWLGIGERQLRAWEEGVRCARGEAVADSGGNSSNIRANPAEGTPAAPIPPWLPTPKPSWTFAGAPRNAERRPRAAGYVSPLRLGNPSDCSQFDTVTLSVVNSPVQMSTPIAISTAPPAPITTG